MKPRARILIGILSLAAAALLPSCRRSNSATGQAVLLLEPACYPHITYYQGRYFFTSQHYPDADTISLAATDDLHQLAHARRVPIWVPDSDIARYHIWSPELHRIQGHWYLYFEADDGNTDNHQLFVLENTADDPLQGTWQMRGILHTNEEWNFGLHPTILNIESGLYLLWSGWPKRRAETETQCIYIARLSNPWTVGSERVMLSHPEYEWERQWINPNGNRAAYPIYVNENPEAFLTPDGRHVCVAYSASGIWTCYTALGLLTAPATADLLDPAVWSKSPEPLFTNLPLTASADTISPQDFYGTSNISLLTDAATSRLITTDNGRQTPMLYEAKWLENNDAERRGIFLGAVRWSDDGLPDFGRPE